jgi:photosystem II stability/assembly factor-like uncharacterized protein
MNGKRSNFVRSSFSFGTFMAKFCKLFLTFAVIAMFCASNARAAWQKVNSNTLAWLHSVYFLDQNNGWIGGSNGTLLLTGDGGNSWTTIRKFTEETIKDIHFADEKHGWLLTEKDIYSAGQLSPSSILETSDGGETWKKARLEDEGRERLARLFFSKDGQGRAVGEAGTFFELQNDARIWKRANISVRYLLLGGSFPDRTKSVVVGGGGSAFFTDDGISWKPSAFTKKTDSRLNTVFFVNKNVGWIVGAGGKIFSTSNGGKIWREQRSPTVQNLLDVYFVNTAEGWAIGDEGTILHTATAGNIWEKTESGTNHKLERIFSNGKNIWTVGFGGLIMVYKANNAKKSNTRQSPILQKRSF